MTGQLWFVHYLELSDLVGFMIKDLRNRGIMPIGGFDHFMRRGMRYRYRRLFFDYFSLPIGEMISNIPRVALVCLRDPFFYRLVVTIIILNPLRWLVRRI